MRHLVAFALAVTLSTGAAAQVVSDPMSWADHFMQKLVSEGPKSAHEEIKKSFLGQVEPDAIGPLLIKMEDLEKASPVRRRDLKRS